MAKRVTRQAPKKKQKAYLTKRALVRATDKASAHLAAEAMRIKGFVVKAEGRWIVKIYNTGKRERISPIKRRTSHQAVALD
jgi:hypothetical protein